MKKTILIYIIILVVMALANVAAADDLEKLFPYYDGDFESDDFGYFSTIIETDNFFSDSEYFPVIEVVAILGKQNLSLSYYGNTEEKNINKDSVPADYLKNSNDSESFFDILYSFNMMHLENDVADISFDVVGKIQFEDGFLNVKDPEKYSFREYYTNNVMPGVNLNLGFFDNLFNLKLTGMGFEYDGETMLDGRADISFNPIPNLKIHGGFRILYLDIEKTGMKSKKTSGSFLGLTLRF